MLSRRHRQVAMFAAIAVAASILSFGTAPPANAATITVPGDHATIQAAVDAATDGDVIVVSPGTYVENVWVQDKSVTIESLDPANPATIDGAASSSRAIMLVDSDSTLRNLRVARSSRNGGGIGINGGAPLVIGNEVTGNGGCSGAGIEARFTEARIENNHIHDNRTSGCSGGTGGNGVMIGGNGAAELVGNLIENNFHSSSGGAVTLNAAGPALIESNIIRNNSANTGGGGLYVINDSPATITNNLFLENSAGTGGAASLTISSSNPGLTITHNTFVDNSAGGGQFYLRGFADSTRIANNVFVGDGAALHCDDTFGPTEIPQFATNLIPNGPGAVDCGDSFDANTVITGDPAFVAAWDGDYRLSDESDAIDAGSAEGITSDFEGDARPIDGDNNGSAIPDIGFDEAPADPPSQIEPPQPPPPPSSFAVDADGRLTWTPPDDATGHIVQWQETRVPAGWLDESPLAPLVVGGAPVNIDRHRYGVFLIGWDGAENPVVQCGGVLIDPMWLLTAAHCTEYRPTGTFLTSVSYLSVVYGMRDWTDIEGNRDRHLRFSDEIVVHPEYDPDLFTHDIALVRLEEPIDPGVGDPIPLIDLTPVDGSPAFVTGWGAIDNNETYPDLVHGAEVEIDESCGTWPDEPGPEWDHNLHICAGAPPAGACSGDSGGPLVVNHEGVLHLVGVTSFGPSGGCGIFPDRPEVFTRVANELEWIESVMGPRGGEAELGGTASGFHLPELLTGRTYAVTVQAENAVGEGEASVLRYTVPGQFLFSASELGVDCPPDPILPFVDMSPTSFAYSAVGCIFELGVTTGTSPTTYSPFNIVTREQIAAFIARLFERVTGDRCRGDHPFTDVSQTSFAYVPVGCIYDLGITKGTSATTYSPADSVTREQMAAFIARLYRLLTGEGCSVDTTFGDVPATSFARHDIGCIASVGITTGTSATTYSPGNPVTREQMAAFIERLFLAVTS